MSTAIVSHDLHQVARIEQARAIGTALRATLRALARSLQRLRQRAVLTDPDLNRKAA
jgi:hypothetical protein